MDVVRLIIAALGFLRGAILFVKERIRALFARAGNYLPVDRIFLFWSSWRLKTKRTSLNKSILFKEANGLLDDTIEWEQQGSVGIRRLSIESIAAVCDKDARNVDMKTFVLFGNGENEVMMSFARLSSFTATDYQFVSSRKDLDHVKNTMRRLCSVPSLNRYKGRTIFVNLGEAEWHPRPRVAEIVKLFNEVFLHVGTGNTVRIVAGGISDTETVRACLRRETRRVCSSSGTEVASVSVEEVYLLEISVFHVLVDKPEPRTEAGFAEASLPYDMVFHLWKACEVDWAQFPYLRQMAEHHDEENEGASGDASAGAGNAVFSSAAAVSISVDQLSETNLSRRNCLTLLFEAAAKVSGKLRAVFEASAENCVELNDGGLPRHYEALSPAHQQKLFKLFQDELQILPSSQEFELLEGKYAQVTQTDNSPKPSAACILDCRRQLHLSGILVGDSGRVAWFDSSLTVLFSEDGVWVRNVPVELMLSILAGIGLTLFYVVKRARQAEVEDLIQTALSILALYVSTIVVIVYRLFHSGESPTNVLSFKQHVDSVTEWNAFSEEERAVLLVRLLQRHPRGKPLVRNKYASFVREASERGSFILTEPTPLENLMVAGFQVLEKDGNLRLRAADGVLADMVEAGTTNSGNRLYEAEWLNSRRMDEEGGDSTWKQVQHSKCMCIQ